MNHGASKFAFSTFLVRFRAITPVFIPRYSGSTFHGAFGRAFYKTECRRPDTDCSDCYLQDECLYYRYFFRTSQGARHPVRPYVMETPPGDDRGLKPGQDLTVLLTLVGESLDHLVRFFPVFETMGRQGLGKGLRRGWGLCSLEAIHNLNGESAVPLFPRPADRPWPPVPVVRGWSDFEEEMKMPVDRIVIQFLTPARIQDHGRLSDEIPFHVLVARLLWRIRDLDREYCGGRMEIPVEDLISLARREVTMVEDRTAWQDWERYSARQDTRMKLGGIVGEAVYQGRLAPFIPYLLIGEYLHVGKQATFGNGVIRVAF